jgi:hypothetical protein
VVLFERFHIVSNCFRYRHELVYYKGAVYVLGGGTSMDSDGFDTIFSFDEDRKEWRKHVTHGDPTVPIDNSIQDQYPTARRCHSVVQEGRCNNIPI